MISTSKKRSGRKEEGTKDGRQVILLQNKKNKKKSLSQIMNEQFDEPIGSGDVGGYNEDSFASGGSPPMIEEYDEVPVYHSEGERGGGGSEVGDTAGGYKRFLGERKRAREEEAAAEEKRSNYANSRANSKRFGAAAGRELSQKSPLRRRGPLDPSLSTGKYLATPRNIEAAMDDLFGGLDMADLEEEANEVIPHSAEEEENDDGEGDWEKVEPDVEGEGVGWKEKRSSGKGSKMKKKKAHIQFSDDDDENGEERNKKKKKKVKRVKDLTEEQYIAYLEEKNKKKKGGLPTPTRRMMDEEEEEEGGDDVFDENILKQKKKTKKHDARSGFDPTLVASLDTPSEESMREEEEEDEEVEELGEEDQQKKDEEEDILAQLASLRSHHIQLVQSTISSGKEQRGGSGKSTSSSTAGGGEPQVSMEVRRQNIRETVRHFMMTYAHLVRVRVQLQSAVMRGLRLPQFYALSLFCGEDLPSLLSISVQDENNLPTNHAKMGTMKKKEMENEKDSKKGLQKSKKKEKGKESKASVKAEESASMSRNADENLSPSFSSSSFRKMEHDGGDDEQSTRDSLDVNHLVNQTSLIAREYQHLRREVKYLLSCFYADAIQALQGSSNSTSNSNSNEDVEEDDGLPPSRKKRKLLHPLDIEDSKEKSQEKRKKKKKEVGGSSGVEKDESSICPDMNILTQYHNKVRTQANHCLAYWGDRLSPNGGAAAVTSTTTPLKTIHQPLTAQIQTLLQSKSRLRVKVQKNRSHLAILGHPEHLRASAWWYDLSLFPPPPPSSSGAMGEEEHPTSRNVGREGETSSSGSLHKEQQQERESCMLLRATNIANGDVDDEIYEDSDFVRELARRGGTIALMLQQQLQEDRKAMLGEGSSPSSSSSLSSSAPGQLRGGGSRRGLHRLTKGKAIDGTPRPKLVGFMVPDSWEQLHPPRNEVMVNSLFQ